MRLQYLILNLLYRRDAKGKLYSLTSKEIQEALSEEGYPYCWRIVYNAIHTLEKSNLLKLGFRKGNSNTYYISTDGMNEMKMHESMEIEEEV